MSKEKFVNYNLEDLRRAVEQSLCWSDVCRAINVTVCTYNYKRIQRLCDANGISTIHFDVKKSFRRGKKNWTAEDIFVENGSISRSRLRPTLIRLGFYPGKCEECDIPDTWNGKPLIIEIDHINGNSRDNRKENLKWLCPNCHSQTPTYRRRASCRSEE